jgi:hypothetical protein
VLSVGQVDAAKELAIYKVEAVEDDLVDAAKELTVDVDHGLLTPWMTSTCSGALGGRHFVAIHSGRCYCPLAAMPAPLGAAMPSLAADAATAVMA